MADGLNNNKATKIQRGKLFISHVFSEIKRNIFQIIILSCFAILVMLIKDYMPEKYPPVASQAQIVEKGITELIEKEIRLAHKPIDSNIRDVYDEGACLIKKIYGQLYEIKGIDNIEKAYRDSDVIINDIQKFNQKVFYSKYDENKKPVEAIITYDVFIKYEYQKQVRYEYKTGKELIKAGYSKGKWLIKYLYIESE